MLMWNNYFFLSVVSFSLFITTPALAQEEDPSCLPPGKKAQKYIDAGNAAKDPQTASENYQKAIDEEPENAACYFAFGKYAFNMGKTYYDKQQMDAGDRSFKKAEAMFEQAAEVCNDYHADMYYYLGVINYAQNETDQSVASFKKFVAFNHTDNNRYGQNYAKQLSDVKGLLKGLEEDQELAGKEVPFNPVMVKNVSTNNQDEYFPMISPDNEMMFFTRKVNLATGYEASRIVEQYTFATRPDDMGEFTKGTPFEKPFNDGSFDSYGASTVSVDNKEMIMCACKNVTTSTGQPYTNCDLYSTTYVRSETAKSGYIWTPLVNLGPKINTPDGWEGQPSLSADGNTLFFTANRRTTKDNDIFIVKRLGDGSWGSAEPFDIINTDGKDKSPFLHQDSETLYFVSTSTDTRKGFGGLDIFYMREENGVWSKPKNIGYPINTPEDELGLFVSTDGQLAYYSSREGGNWNIFQFELYEEARPKAVTILKGELKDPNGAPVTDATIEVAYSGSDKVESVKVNGDDGKYAVVVKTEVPQDVMVSVKKEGAAFDSRLIAKEDIVKKEERVNNDLAVKELKVGEAYTINDILYDYNSDVLSARSKFILREFARYLKDHEGITITIQGHTDSDGDDAKNMDLSDRRAKGVKTYLVSLGIDESRLEAKGYGESQPKVANDTAENKAKNRRTDFLITGM